MKNAVSLSELRHAFGDDAGVLPDGRVEGSHQADWRELMSTLRRSGWTTVWVSDGRGVEDDELDNHERFPDAFRVRVAGALQVNFFSGEEVAFDIDLRELIDQRAADALCTFVKLLSRSLGKPVVISREGSWNDVVLRYDHVTNEFSLGSPSDTGMQGDLWREN